MCSKILRDFKFYFHFSFLLGTYCFAFYFLLQNLCIKSNMNKKIKIKIEPKAPRIFLYQYLFGEFQSIQRWQKLSGILYVVLDRFQSAYHIHHRNSIAIGRCVFWGFRLYSIHCFYADITLQMIPHLPSQFIFIII